MRHTWLVLAACVVLVLAELVPGSEAGPYFEDDESFPNEDEYSENAIDKLLQTQKRACIRRGGNCDHRPNDCCYNSSCRCNLWGSNCRCQRMGLFQKWG
ncbi:putative neurotoxin isoform X2 [Aethina tumida]|uniref:putative neurotoxin isoform X2 n=1 Tax=Aethina tumida TaxID=116153 RepID=UPI00096B58AC|nr:putative neurotoxin isoform X2 [Aethina tumida]